MGYIGILLAFGISFACFVGYASWREKFANNQADWALLGVFSFLVALMAVGLFWGANEKSCCDDLARAEGKATMAKTKAEACCLVYNGEIEKPRGLHIDDLGACVPLIQAPKPVW